MVVEREILLEGDVAEVWPLIASAHGWQQWLVDEAMVEVAVGETGDVVDDGVTRGVRISEVDEHSSVTFQWWERDDPSSVSEVIIEVHPLLGGGSRVLIVERVMCMSVNARRGTNKWEVRALLLALTQCTLARV